MTTSIDKKEKGSLPELRQKIKDMGTVMVVSLGLVNVNLPREPKGVAWTRQSVRHYDGRVVPGEDPMGRKHYGLAIRPIEEVEEGTDRWAVRQGLVSMTPLRVDLTDEEVLARMNR